ncbi:hypothetical protein EDI_050020 [Entamoeba dispar SAW760]|uniref:TLDc domain-containing protein n=1 Tax=Entamoeba dispar (strain ATCC PRA-260 / SAW760) TaxID=370354 RepID=B0EK15_ENTDS|nr:uncharacterized protein EDI_050020 [Entamoeba dispar SAW760]EDR25142.1 hypothetical protein EDI_050020 [Entamoeba dispar SAW760]|eukprot:EDR25142.1 hypothetical protein EDI_050020 [Entamoeba dispar SAW760]
MGNEETKTTKRGSLSDRCKFEKRPFHKIKSSKKNRFSLKDDLQPSDVLNSPHTSLSNSCDILSEDFIKSVDSKKVLSPSPRIKKISNNSKQQNSPSPFRTPSTHLESPLNSFDMMSYSPQLTLTSEYCLMIKKWFSSIKNGTEQVTNGYTVLYDSNYLQLSSRDIYSVVSGKNNFFIIVRLFSGELFGSYYSKTVPCRNSSTRAEIDSDQNHFIFVIQNFSTKPTLYHPVNLKKSLVIHPISNSDLVITIPGAFWVTSDGKVFSNSNINLTYKNAIPLARRVVPYSNPLYHLSIIQLTH